ncbi:MAG: hypothetical protein ACMUIA_07570 [bacterium]
MLFIKGLKKDSFIKAGFFLIALIFWLFSGSAARAEDPLSMSKTLNLSNTAYVYKSFTIEIKASSPFKISFQFEAVDGETYWITYASTNAGVSYDPMEGLIEMGIGSGLTDGKWHTLERNIQVDLDQAGSSTGYHHELNSLKKVNILGSKFGVRFISVFYEREVNGYLNKYYKVISNFEAPDIQSMDDPLYELGWTVNYPNYFFIEYDENLNGYLLAERRGSGSDSSSYHESPNPIVYSPTDFGSVYSPYSVAGGYYDNFYGLYGGYGMGGYGLGGYGLGGYGLGGYGLYGLGGYGLGGYGLYGLGGYGLPYSMYGYPYSSYGGLLGASAGLDLALLTGTELGLSSLLGGTGLGLSPFLGGTGLGLSPLLGGITTPSLLADFGISGLYDTFQDLPTFSVDIPTLVPSTSNISLSALWGLGSLGISGLSDVTVPISTFVPGSTTVNIPDLSSLLSIY